MQLFLLSEGVTIQAALTLATHLGVTDLLAHGTSKRVPSGFKAWKLRETLCDEICYKNRRREHYEVEIRLSF
jgi:hypothetical protein